MGHRDLPGTSWPGQYQHDQNISCNNDMQQHMHFGYVGSSDPYQAAYPVGNTLISQGQGQIQVHPNWSNSTISVGYGFQHHQNNEPPLYHPYPPLATVPAISGSHVYPPSNTAPLGFYQYRPSYESLRMDGRWSSKRKGSAVPSGGEDFRFTGPGSSSRGGIRHANIVQEKSYLDCTHHWEHHAMCSSSSSSGSRPVRDEGVTRNVRRRYESDVQPGLVAPVVSVPPFIPNGHSGLLDSTNWTSSGVNPSWRHSHVSSFAPGRMPVADLSSANQSSGHLLRGSAASTFSYDTWRNQNHFHGTRNPFDQQHSFGTVSRPMQAALSYSQQCHGTFRNPYTLYGAGPSHGYPQIGSANYSSMCHPMPFQGEVFSHTSTNAPRIPQERHRFLPSDIRDPGRYIRGGLFNGDQDLSAIQDMLDQHSDMRLDVDNMSYEELLALGDRIGNVSTGLSDDAVSKCLMEVMHQTLTGHGQDEESCSICLEEYIDGDSVGKLKGCAHSYHSSCIKKWLSMKNSCPICKAPGLAAENI